MNKIKLLLNKQITIINANPDIFKRIKKLFTIQNPAFQEAQKYGRYTGNIDRVLCFYKEDQGNIKCPRGYLRQILEITGRDIVFEDKRRVLPQLDIHFCGKLRPYQKKALDTIYKKDFAVLESLTGSGKTVIALSLIAARQQPTLIIVSTVELLNQWHEMIGKFLAISAGRIGNGKFEIKSITVGIVNTVSKYLAKLPQYFGQIVFDEVHRMSCPRMIAVAKEFDCKMMFSCSATPYRRDGLTKVIHFYAGPLAHKIDPVELQDTGAVLIPEIQTRETEFNYQKLLSLIVVDEDRNNLIIRDVMTGARRPGTALIVSDRVEHCVVLHDLLKTMPGSGLKVKILTGQLKSKERTSLVEDIRAGKIDVVIATIQLIGEGFDCPGLSSLFLATPIKFSGRLIQVVGRILRPADGKKPRVYDYRDPVGPLFASARTREKTYREMRWIDDER